MPHFTIEPCIRIITRENQVVGLNPTDISTFSIEVKATHTKLKKDVKPQRSPSGQLMNDPVDFETFTADCIRFFLKNGRSLTYIVGENLMEQEFNYICECLHEMTYLTSGEKDALKKAELAERTKAFEQAQ